MDIFYKERLQNDEERAEIQIRFSSICCSEIDLFS